MCIEKVGLYNAHCKSINYSLRNWVKQEMGQIRREDIFADALTPFNILYKDLNAKFFKKQLSPPEIIMTNKQGVIKQE